MKDVLVLGSGCMNCKKTAQLIQETAQECGETISLTKVEDMQKIVSYGVMATPGVIIDGKIVHAGGVPSKEKVKQWFEAA